MISLPTGTSGPTLDRLKRWRIGTLSYSAVGLAALFSWLLWGDFTWAMKDRAVIPIFQLLLKNHGASDFAIGVLMGALPSILGVIVGPVISYQSDRHRGSWGRRIPYLLAITPPVSAAMLLLGFSPEIGSWIHCILGSYSPGVDGIILTTFAFFWAVFEFGSIAANIVFGALINDVVPPQVLGRFYGMFRIVSLGAGIGVNFWVLGLAEQYAKWIFVVIGVLYGGGFLLMCWKVREGEYPPVNDASSAERSGAFEASRLYLKDCFGQSYYRWLLGAMAMFTLSFTPVNLFSVVYAKSLGVSMEAYGKCYAITFAISLVISFPIGMVTDRLHPLLVTLVAVALFGAIALAGAFFISDGMSFLIALGAVGVLAGCYWTSSASLGNRLFPRSRYAQFASANGILLALGSLIMAPLIGSLLDLTGHQYRYSFLISACLAGLSLILGGIVYVKFKRLGGGKSYVPPE